jgi:hypothetical protein
MIAKLKLGWVSCYVGRRGLARLKRLIRNQQFMGSNPIGGFQFNHGERLG